MKFRIPDKDRRETLKTVVGIVLDHVERRARLALGRVPFWVEAARDDLLWALEKGLDNQADASDNGDSTGYPEEGDRDNGQAEVSSGLGSGFRIPRSRATTGPAELRGVSRRGGGTGDPGRDRGGSLGKQ